MTKKLRYIIYVCIFIIIITIIAAVSEIMTGRKTEADSTNSDAVSTTSDAYVRDVYANLNFGDNGATVAVLDTIRNDLSVSDYVGAAKSILDSEDILSALWTDVLSGRPAYYTDDGTLTGKDTGRGLMITGDRFFYFGDFVDGVPQGGGCAFTAYNADYQMYMYSTGIWEQGHMQGVGETGFAYLDYPTTIEDIPAKMDSQAVISADRTGTFVDDLMEGEVTMTIRYLDGQPVTYKFTAKHGTTDISDWEYDNDRESYKLYSEEDTGYIYELGKSQINEARWKNPLGWAY